MRALSVATAIVTSGLLVGAQAQLLPFLSKATPDQPLSHPQHHQQLLMDSGPGIQLPPSQGDDDGDSKPQHPPPNSGVILSDVIGNQRSINIFAGFTRDIDSVSSRLDSSRENATVLAPLNSALTSLPRKPWEDPREYAAMGEAAYAGSAGEDRAHANLRRFVEAHIVTASPWKEGEKAKTMGGGTVWWETTDGKARLQPGNIEIEKVVSRVANGEVWAIKGVVNYAS